jgi:hypothetical protein
MDSWGKKHIMTSFPSQKGSDCTINFNIVTDLDLSFCDSGPRARALSYSPTLDTNVHPVIRAAVPVHMPAM